MTTNLLGLRAENYKRLELVAVEFPPEGGVVAIMGENGAGKSSLLDALESTIAGRKAPKVAKPIHNDAESARIVATFDDIVVERVFKVNGTTQIKVRAADGRQIGRAEELLNRLYSHVALDPLEFSRLTDREQVATLLPMIGFDPAPLEAERQEVYDLRTVKNREVDSLAARVAAFPDPPAGLPREEIVVAELMGELEAASKSDAERERLEQNVALARSGMIRIESSILEQERQIAEVEARLAALRAGREESSAALTAAGENVIAATDALNAFVAVDPEPIRQAIAEAESTNRAIRSEVARREVEAALKIAREESATLTAKIAEIESRKSAALEEARAKMPVPNLSIEDGVLTLDGIPFADASTGQKIRTGTAIAMALNPDLRLIVIRDASLLDQENRAVIDSLAKDNGFLVLMELADENAPVGVVIDEGRVREVRS